MFQVFGLMFSHAIKVGQNKNGQAKGGGCVEVSGWRIETGDDNISFRSKFNGIEKNELSEPGRSRSHLDSART